MKITLKAIGLWFRREAKVSEITREPIMEWSPAQMSAENLRALFPIPEPNTQCNWCSKEAIYFGEVTTSYRPPRSVNACEFHKPAYDRNMRDAQYEDVYQMGRLPQ